MRILIVEDEVVPANYLKKILELENYVIIDIVSKGIDAIKMAKDKKPDVILMDIMLKDNISGAEAATQIYALIPNIIIIFLTAYSDKEMIDFAVESNAFAYLLKPYRDKEILATLSLAKAKYEERKSRVSNTEKYSDTKIILVDKYMYDIKLHRLFKNNKEVKLSKKELKLIDVLCKYKNISVELDVLMKSIWDNIISEQALRSLICRVREKTSHNLIINNNGFGYSIGLK